MINMVRSIGQSEAHCFYTVKTVVFSRIGLRIATNVNLLFSAASLLVFSWLFNIRVQTCSNLVRGQVLQTTRNITLIVTVQLTVSVKHPWPISVNVLQKIKEDMSDMNSFFNRISHRVLIFCANIRSIHHWTVQRTNIIGEFMLSSVSMYNL